MECQICSRKQNSVAALICPGCARTALFPLRCQQAQILVEKERIGRQIEAITDPYDSKSIGTSDIDVCGNQDGATRTIRCASTQGQLNEMKSRLESVTTRAAELRNNVEKLTAKLHERRTKIDGQRRHLQQAKADTTTQRTSGQELLRKRSRESRQRGDTQYKDIVAARINRCKQAITFAGLKQIVRPRESERRTPQYCVWNLLIPEIRNLNNAEPSHVSTVLGYIARLLCQVSTYLQVRLPAEITMPHNDWPAPTIFSPASSYSARDFQSPKSMSGSFKDSSAKASRELGQHTAGRPRPLSIDRKLPKLAKENPQAYGMFVEGVALLAWDIAWLCRIQGLPVAEKEWDDVCDMGRNLWLLFANAPDAPVMLRKRRSSKDAVTTIKHAGGARAFSSPLIPTALGVPSHGSATHFLESSTPDDVAMCDISPKGWAFAFPIKIIDELKAALLTDMSGHDWELLDDRDDELADGTDAEETVVIDKTKQSASSAALARDDKGEDKKGTSGWTKLKSRSPP